MLERPPPKWPDPDDKAVVAEMLADPNSSHWSECLEFIRKSVQYANIPPYLKDDVVQNTMLSVFKGLAKFHFDCKLTYWLTTITTRRIIDVARKHSYESQWLFSTSSSSKDTESEGDTWDIPDAKTTEEICLMHEESREIDKELLSYLVTRKHPERDQQILEMFWFDGLKQKEIAQRIGIEAPMIGYVIRAAQSYLRKKRKDEPPPELPI